MHDIGHVQDTLKTIEIVMPFINLGVWNKTRNLPKKLRFVLEVGFDVDVN